MLRFHPHVLLPAVIALVFGAGGGLARAQEKAAPEKTAPLAAPGDPDVRLLPAQAKSFKGALAGQAAQASVAFVAEGAPLRPTLGGAQAPSFPTGLPLAKAVAKVADAYDYDASRQGRVFVLRKRYTDPQDLPGVTLEECTQAMQDMINVLEPFNPHVPPWHPGISDPLIADFMASLTPEQQQALEAKTLRVASLGPSQQALVRRLALNIYVQTTADDVNVSLAGLKQAPQAAFSMGGSNEPSTFGYHVTDTYGRDVFVTFDMGGGPALMNGVPVTIGTAPPDVKMLAATRGVTLGRVVADLNAGLNAGGKPRLLVDAALQAKPITVENTGAVSPAQMMKALAEVYGLEVRLDDKGVQRLSRRRYLPPSGVTGLPAVMRVIMPAPLLRAAHDEYWATQATRKDPDGGLMMRQQQLVGWIRAEAARRLQAAVTPLLAKAGPNGRVPVSSLGEPERQAFAASLTAQCLDMMTERMPMELPYYITRWDDLCVYGGPFTAPDGKQWYSMQMGVFDPASQAVQGGVGVTMAHYGPSQP